MPLPTPVSEFHGLLTFTIAQILTNVERPLTYRDLVETVSMVYRGQGVFQPTPLIEGTGLDREVMGKREFRNRPQITFTGIMLPPDSYELSAGHLMGLREGSIVEVFMPAAAPNANDSLGTAKVVKASATRALVKPEKWKTYKAARKNLISAGCRAKIVYEKMALDQMQVVVQIDDGEAVTSPKDLPKEVATLIASTPNKYKSWKWADSIKDASWILRFKDEEPSLIPASGWSAAFNTKAPPEFKVTTSDEIGNALNQLARARQLVHIASGKKGNSDVKMKVELVRFSGIDDSEGKPVKHSGQGRVLKSGEEIAFKISNQGRASIDVSLLFVDSGYGITALFPEPGTIDDNRIPPGTSLVTPRLEVTAETAGAEQIVALGVRSTRDRVDFSCLEQASLEQTRGMPALDTPLGELLRGAIYGEGETRGLSRSRSSDHATSLITWTTLPE